MAKAKNDQVRCPHCGATDISLDLKSGKLKCNFCRGLIEGDASVNATGDLEKLTEHKINGGAANIIPDEKTILTLKCKACGAEIVVNTDEATTARCHWCRHVLSINEKQPNGAVPDMVLPFKLEKGVAEKSIREFVSKRKFFAHPKFKQEFSTENVMGVYLPYMVIDINARVQFRGEAEHQIRKYTRGSGNSERTYYDAEVYDVVRDFSLYVDDLTIESSKDKMNQNVLVNSNNVINAVMPFDTENAVAWDARYLRGYASEKRDTNVDGLAPIVQEQVKDIARYQARTTMTYYDRGTVWNSEQIQMRGSDWKAAYLPIWLYSYLEDDGKKKLLHYVAVNARTGETSGSVPVNKSKLMAASVLVEIVGIILGTSWIRFWLLADIDEDNPALWGLLGLAPGFVFYWLQMRHYRSLDARHIHEKDTRSEMKDLKKSDKLRGTRKELTSSRIRGENGNAIKGSLANGASHMLGEDISNALGLGRMTGSTDQNVAEVKEKAKKKNKISTIVVWTIIILFILFFFVL